jgi:hypothetical protein
MNPEESNSPSPVLFVRQGTSFTVARAMSIADISVIPAGLATAPSAIDSWVEVAPSTTPPVSRPITEVIINYQRTYWEVGMDLLRKAHTAVVRPDIVDAAITNLYIGLIKLFGMHWTPTDKQRYNSERDRIYLQRFKGRAVEQTEQDVFDSEYPPTAKDYTFTLYTMVRAGYVLAKGWDISRVDGGSLMNRFKRLNSYFTDLSRHFEQKKVEAAVSLALSDLDVHVQTVMDVIRWFMGMFYGTIPDYAKTQFRDIFGISY